MSLEFEVLLPEEYLIKHIETGIKIIRNTATL